MIDYSILYKHVYPTKPTLDIDDEWDIFISSYTTAERVMAIFDKVNAKEKHWMVFKEYCYRCDEFPKGNVFSTLCGDEATYIKRYWEWAKSKQGKHINKKRICIDITGFIRPYMIFLILWLFEQGVRKFDVIYSEPDHYKQKENTEFSIEPIINVRQIIGYEGTHDPNTSNDLLIIGSGYDYKLIEQVAFEKKHAKKRQIFGFPSLHADMYQENVINACQAEEAVGENDAYRSYFAPANDPFITANVLRDIVSDFNKKSRITNLYLSPLSTKPQAIGFALYYLTEWRDKEASIIFPFSAAYTKETTKGISRVWKYTIESC